MLGEANRDFALAFFMVFFRALKLFREHVAGTNSGMTHSGSHCDVIAEFCEDYSRV